MMVRKLSLSSLLVLGLLLAPEAWAGAPVAATQASPIQAAPGRDVAVRLAELRQQVEAAAKSQRTLMAAADYSGEFKAYVNACQTKILDLGSRKYQAGGAQAQGELTAFIHILADGTVQSVKIYKSSGHAELDELLKATVLEAAPFARFPQSLAKDYDRLALTLRLRYRTD